MGCKKLHLSRAADALGARMAIPGVAIVTDPASNHSLGVNASTGGERKRWPN